VDRATFAGCAALAIAYLRCMAESLTVLTHRNKQAQIQDTIERYENKLAQARADLAHVSAALTIFEASGDPIDLARCTNLRRLFRYQEMFTICRVALEREGPLNTVFRKLLGRLISGAFFTIYEDCNFIFRGSSSDMRILPWWFGAPMPEPRSNAEIDAEWGERAKRVLRAQMTLSGVNAAGLAEKLTAMGVKEREKNVANKIARGGFTAAFFLQCMSALGVHTLHLDGR